jgi:hypothetical protein
VRPFGGASIEQLILEFRPGAASTGLTRVAPARLAARPKIAAALGPKVALATVFLALAVAVALAIALR